MQATQPGLRLTAVELSGAAVTVGYSSGKSGHAGYQPDWIRLGPEGLFIPWTSPPAGLKYVTVEWDRSPFASTPLRVQCSIRNQRADGVEAVFEEPVPQALHQWFEGATASLNLRPPDAAVRTSRLYTNATVVSAGGLLCGALAILLPLLIGDQEWVDLASKILLVLMVASIGGFAWIRRMAGREEVRAIGQSRG